MCSVLMHFQCSPPLTLSEFPNPLQLLTEGAVGWVVGVRGWQGLGCPSITRGGVILALLDWDGELVSGGLIGLTQLILTVAQ